ncbi:MAG: aminotransferase class V-fold PLP-dependent enzyme, partial [Candidatus Taylorbacteria bacterium]|nr:aminotransferase class V-fold PLP-dependent enzyme [Candidatus Taylorbacteria bacterium]
MSRKRKKKRVYLDYASITPMAPEVRREMQRFSRAEYMNPSSIHAEGYLAKRALDEARARAARFFGGRADEIIFTGGGTEANNLAVFGVVESLLENGEKPEELHIIT